MVFVVHVRENPLRHYQVQWLSAWMRIVKWKVVITGRDGPRGFCGKKALHCQVYTVGYLRFVEKAPAGSTVFSWARSFSSGKGTAQAAVREWYCNTAIEWFREAIRSSQRDGRDV
jgi:hypothetical protein